MISIVTTPTDEWLEKHVRECRERFLVASPFVGASLVALTKRVPAKVSRVLLTRTDLRDFAAGASDIGALCDTAQLGTRVLSLARLHAKVYVIDATYALVTSANATHGGMRRNWECGVALRDEATVDLLAGLVQTGFGATEKPQPWTLAELVRLREPVRLLREAMPPPKQATEFDWEEHPRITLPQHDWERLCRGMPGWTRLVLDGVAQIHDDEFDTSDVFRTCAPMIAKRFPANRFPREKVRQQLQRLRDLGIIEFRGEGRYRRALTRRADPGRRLG